MDAADRGDLSAFDNWRSYGVGSLTNGRQGPAMKAMLVVLAALSLAGCSTPGGLMQKEPEASLVSAKPLSEYMQCEMSRIFMSSWSESHSMPVGDSQVIVVTGSAFGGAVAMIEVRPSGSGSEIAIRRATMVTDHVFETIEADARACI